MTIVRTQAKRVAEEEDLKPIIIDGPPGIGCPVIASITGADLVLIVTEPTLSARHDLERAAALAGHFGIQVVVCINKCDLNLEMTAEIRDWCLQNQIVVVGQVPYDTSFTEAQMKEQSIVEYCSGSAARAVHELWSQVVETMEPQDDGTRSP